MKLRLRRWYIIRLSDGAVVATTSTQWSARFICRLGEVNEPGTPITYMRATDWRREHPR